MARAIDGELLISIHAPREGCDVQPYLRPYCIPISIHAPREGCDEHLTEADFVLEAFQSAPPAGGATGTGERQTSGGTLSNPRAPRGGRRSYGQRKEDNLDISIHAPREGCDGRRHCGAWASSNFNPRTPRGVRQGGGNSLRPLFLFQSTHPARGATPAALPGADQPGISIHAPREGCDLSQFVDTTSRAISIHAPREGCDAVYAGTHRCHMNFNPRTPRGVRPKREAHICRVQ